MLAYLLTHTVVKPGSHVYIDDGLIDLVVKSIGADFLVCDIASRTLRPRVLVLVHVVLP